MEIIQVIGTDVITYEVEIWGWEEKKELEKIMIDYIRWIFNLDFCTSRYISEKRIKYRKAKNKMGNKSKKI